MKTTAREIPRRAVRARRRAMGGRGRGGRSNAWTRDGGQGRGGRGHAAVGVRRRDLLQEDLLNEKPNWALSCYGPKGEQPNLLGGDTSFEELRCAAYATVRAGGDAGGAHSASARVRRRQGGRRQGNTGVPGTSAKVSFGPRGARGDGARGRGSRDGRNGDRGGWGRVLEDARAGARREGDAVRAGGWDGERVHGESAFVDAGCDGVRGERATDESVRRRSRRRRESVRRRSRRRESVRRR